MSMPKVDLTLLKQLIAELETSVATSDVIPHDTNHNDYIVEMAKASGLAMGIATEAYLLAGDMQTLLRTSANAAAGDKAPGFKGILQMLKGGGGPGDEN